MVESLCIRHVKERYSLIGRVIKHYEVLNQDVKSMLGVPEAGQSKNLIVEEYRRNCVVGDDMKGPYRYAVKPKCASRVLSSQGHHEEYVYGSPYKAVSRESLPGRACCSPVNVKVILSLAVWEAWNVPSWTRLKSKLCWTFEGSPEQKSQ
jgi:hypothetical protein